MCILFAMTYLGGMRIMMFFTKIGAGQHSAMTPRPTHHWSSSFFEAVGCSSVAAQSNEKRRKELHSQKNTAETSLIDTYVLFVWEVLGGIPDSRDTSKEVTGWDISGWDSTGKSEEEQTAIREKKAAAQQCFLRAGGKTGVLDDTSSAEQVEEAAVALQEAMVGALNSHARRKRWCSRSKPWWTEDLAGLRKELGRERRRPAGIGRARDARRNLWRAIRKAKKECWNRFLQEAKGGEVWVAASYTAPRLDRTGQALADEDGNIAESQDEREAAILKTSQQRVDRHLSGSMLT